MSKAIILNGPPGVGKDTLANLLVQALEQWDKPKQAKHREFKSALFDIALAISGMSTSEWHYNYHRDRKEVAHPALAGKSPREFLIHISEVVVKPLYGDDFFGKRALLKTKGDPAHYHVFSDGGFLSELIPLTELHEVVVFRLFRDDCSFKGDSRNYINPIAAQEHGIVVYDLHLELGKPHIAVQEMMNAVSENYAKRMGMLRNSVEGALYE